MIKKVLILAGIFCITTAYSYECNNQKKLLNGSKCKDPNISAMCCQKQKKKQCKNNKSNSQNCSKQQWKNYTKENPTSSKPNKWNSKRETQMQSDGEYSLNQQSKTITHNVISDGEHSIRMGDQTSPSIGGTHDGTYDIGSSTISQ